MVFATNTNAQTKLNQESRSDFSLGVEGGTTGFGPVLIYTASSKFNFAVSYGLISSDDDNVKGDNSRYDYDIRLSNLAALANWHPWAKRFHLTAGAILYSHKFEFTARPRNNKRIDVGDNSYDKTEITSLTGKINTGSTIAPYVGFGWNWVLGKSGLSLTTDFGLMFTQGYDTKLTATGPVANDATFISDLNKEQEDLSDVMKVFPVLKAGLVYRF